MTTPEGTQLPFPDREDQETDKLGSAALGKMRLYGELPQEYLPHRAERPDNQQMSSAARRRISKLAAGAQVGEDALDTVDQSRTQEGYQELHAQVSPIADKLFEERIQRERQEAMRLGNNPDAIERAMRARRQGEKN